MKIYLDPRNERRGQPILHFIKREKDGYWLGTYFDLHKTNLTMKRAGYGYEYDSVSGTRISKETYSALLKQAKENRAKYGK